MPDDPGSLYERDFFLWTRQQGEALRTRGAGGNRLDHENLAEEVEDLGSAQRNKAESFARLILAHLYKLEASQQAPPRGHWRAEILNWRADLERALTPTIRRHLEDALEPLHGKAAAIAQESLSDHEPGLAVDRDRRWSLSEILGEENDPLA